MKKVAVLMATYNSERFMRQQIDSILAQQGVEVDLLVRDDGSTDGSRAILDEYASKGLLRWYTGPNLKSARCFMQLLADAPDADFYAFADHDDYWMPDKLSVAVASIADSVDRPALYLAQPQSADVSLQPIPATVFKPLGTFAESMIYWFAMGCTMVLNHPLRTIINSYTPQYLYMHDVWIYSIAHAVGSKVVWDPVPHTLNRQHGGNVVGLEDGRMGMLKLRLRRFMNGGEVRYRQACELQQGYEPYITEDNKALLTRFVDAKHSILSRLSLIFDSHYRCSDTTTQRLFWMNVLFNKY